MKFLKRILDYIPRNMYQIGLKYVGDDRIEWGYITPRYECFLDEEAQRLEDDENDYYYVYRAVWCSPKWLAAQTEFEGW